MSEFMDRYLAAVEMKGTPLCVGLDPTIVHVPEAMRDGGRVTSIGRYLRRVIDIAAPEVSVVKPQFAYYEALGPEGIQMMIETVKYAHNAGLLVILDHKISDIGETMVMYRDACWRYGVDAVTFVPYLGSTFLPDPEKELDEAWLPWLSGGNGVIPMIMTSNPEAKQLQHLQLDDGRLVYQAMADLVTGWASQVEELTSGVGMVAGVVGATYPDEAVAIRARIGDNVPFLVPGYGAQGGGSDGAVAGLPTDGVPRLFVNSSRGVTWYSWFDRKTKQPRVGDPLELIHGSIVEAKMDIAGALSRKQAA